MNAAAKVSKTVATMLKSEVCGFGCGENIAKISMMVKYVKEEKGIVTVKQQTSKVMTKVQEPNELDVPKKETFDVMISPKLASSLQAVSKIVKSDIIEFREFSEKNQ